MDVLDAVRKEREKLVLMGKEPVSIVLPNRMRAALLESLDELGLETPHELLGMRLYFSDVDRPYGLGRWPD